ncbi:MRG-domain-containing protein [Mycena leptocephala]|nr:MRG-domain-containing protein [Mycena leptocephala]
MTLPRSPCVQEILDELEKTEHRRHCTTGAIAAGLVAFFDQVLGRNLLYRPEHAQYLEMCHGEIMPNQIYGAEHLLRMLVTLTVICGRQRFPAAIVDYAGDLLPWMIQERRHFFQQRYLFTNVRGISPRTVPTPVANNSAVGAACHEDAIDLRIKNKELVRRGWVPYARLEDPAAVYVEIPAP